MCYTINTNRLAGSSVPPANLWSMIFLISRDAHIKHKLYEELMSAEKAGRIPPTTYIISEDQAKQLPYLHACVHESLRFAPTISQLPRLSPRGTGLELGGRYVPPGYSVSTSPWIIGRSKALYGPDADVYRPERWLEASPRRLRKWDTESFHFGYGGRKCAAKGFALMQMYKAVAEVCPKHQVQLKAVGQRLIINPTRFSVASMFKSTVLLKEQASGSRQQSNFASLSGGVGMSRVVQAKNTWR